MNDQHHKTVQALEEIQAAAKFICLTTVQGARGVDIKNPQIAHVQFNYQPVTVAECVQGSGRGSRSLDIHTTASVICHNPVTEDPATFLKVLDAKNYEFSKDLDKYTSVPSWSTARQSRLLVLTKAST